MVKKPTNVVREPIDDFFDHSIERDMFYCHTCGKHSEDMDDEEYELHINTKPAPKKGPPMTSISKDNSKVKEILVNFWASGKEGDYKITEATQAINLLLEEARIDELKHIDDPVNVQLYHYGLISVKDRIKELSAGAGAASAHPKASEGEQQ